MKLEILTFGIPKMSWAQPVAAQYQQKVTPFFPLTYNFIKSKEFLRKNADECRRQQSRILSEEIDSDSFVILFDERGKAMDSRKFAELIGQAVSSGKRKTQFIIGGHYGVDEELRGNCHAVVALSSLVFNQEVALTAALEQIYRALTIINNLPYHND